jgi:hypothetical protein
MQGVGHKISNTDMNFTNKNYQLFGSEMPQEDLFTGIYNNQFYKAGIIVKNNRTKHILHANTNGNGRVLASDKIQYFNFKDL